MKKKPAHNRINNQGNSVLLEVSSYLYAQLAKKKYNFIA